MPKFGVTFDGLDDYMDRLEKLGGTKAVKRGVEAGLRSSKEYVNTRLDKAVASSNLPAKGKYSASPHVKDTIDRDMSVNWNGLTGEIHVGFDLKKAGGFTSIYLMYGTPKMSPVKGLKASVYGAKTKKDIQKLEEEAFNKVIKRIMEG